MNFKADDLVTYASEDDIITPKAVVYSIKDGRATLIEIESGELMYNVPVDKLILTPDQSESTKNKYTGFVGGHTLRRSKKRKSTRRKSTKRKSMKRKSMKRKSMKRKAIRRKSMKRKNTRRRRR